MRENAGGAPIAIHTRHQWEVDGQEYLRVDGASAKIHVHFERDAKKKSRVHGPFKNFAAVDGLAYTDDKVFAFLDKLGEWFCYDDGFHWPVMVVTDATAQRRNSVFDVVAGFAPHLPGVLALWEGARLLYLGRAEGSQTIHSRVLDLLGERGNFSGTRVTACTWEPTDQAAKREAEVLHHYQSGSTRLLDLLGTFLGNAVRTQRLVNGACEARQRAGLLVDQARAIRARRAA